MTEEFFDVPNPRFKSNQEALQAGFAALYALAEPIILEMMTENAANARQERAP